MRKDFQVNDLLYAVVGYGGVNKYHQFVRVESISQTGRYKISVFPSKIIGQPIVRNGVKYTYVEPNLDIVRQVRLINTTRYQSDLDCTYVNYDSSKILTDAIELTN
jgi:hypothetical protein